MSNKPTSTRYLITLESPHMPDDPQGHRRLRRWLKASWRGYALKCVDIGLAVTDPADGLQAAQGGVERVSKSE